MSRQFISVILVIILYSYCKLILKSPLGRINKVLYCIAIHPLKLTLVCSYKCKLATRS